MLVDTFNNLLSEENQAGWTQLQNVSSGSQTLLQNAERYGKIFAGTLSSADNSTIMVVRENISECWTTNNTSSCSQLRCVSIFLTEMLNKINLSYFLQLHLYFSSSSREG